MVEKKIDILKYRWAAIKTGRKAWRLYGRKTTLTQDDADTEALLALVECPRTFKAEKGHFGCYVKRAAYNAVRRSCEKHSAYVVVEEAREAEPQTVLDRGEGLRRHLERYPQHEAAIRELLDSKRKPSRSALAVMGFIRKQIGDKPKRSWMLSSVEVAKRLGTVDRRVRALCEAGTLPAVRKAGEWKIAAADLRKYRHARAMNALAQGATLDEAAKRAGMTTRRIRQLMKAAKTA